MGKPRYEMPTRSFPYKIPKRLCVLSIPKPVFAPTSEGMPAFSVTGVRKSALRGQATDRVHDSAYPFLKNLLLIRKTYKNKFSPERLQNLDRMIEAVNGLCYTKYANAVIDLRKLLGVGETVKSDKRKKGWSETEWKKHMDYISLIAAPRPDFEPPPLSRGEKRPLADLAPRIVDLARVPDTKMYRRPSEENWYRDPIKVRRTALVYVISDRTKELAKPKVLKE